MADHTVEVVLIPDAEYDVVVKTADGRIFRTHLRYTGQRSGGHPLFALLEEGLENAFTPGHVAILAIVPSTIPDAGDQRP